MKSLYRVILLLLISCSARAQYPTLFFDASVTGSYGTLSCTTVGTGAFTTGGGGSCFPGSGVNSWWIGGGGVGSYLHTFSRPVYRIMIPDWALNGGTLATAEYKTFKINGALYSLSPAEMISNATTCPATGIPCYVSGGRVYGPLGTGGDYNGDTVLIQSCDPILTIEMGCGNCSSGDVYIMYVDTTKPPSCQRAVANTPCVLDTLFFAYVGDSTGATYKWSGPGGYTSTSQYNYRFPASYTDTGLYIAYRTKLGVTDTDSVYVNVVHCSSASANDPCEGDTLRLSVSGDSVGVTYKWKGPKGVFTSTLHHPSKYPALLSDTGVYYVYRSVLGVSDTDSVRVVIHSKLKQTVTDNAPMCANTVDTLFLQSSPSQPGATYQWSGPGGFTSTSQTPTIIPFITVDTGIYTVVSTTIFGCKDTGHVRAWLVDPPLAPQISGHTPYCQDDPTGANLSAVVVPAGSIGTIKWDTLPLQRMRMGAPPTFVMPGIHIAYATTTNSFGCEGPRDTFSVKVITVPAPPLAAGQLDYCQNIGPFVPLIVTPIHTGSLIHWWKVPTGGTYSPTEPGIDLTVSGTVTFYISQNDSGCESKRATVVTTIHPKPKPPTIKSDTICQFYPASPMVATVSGSGDVIRWFIPPDTIGSVTAPTPITLVPGVYPFVAHETTSFGCVSNDTTGYMTVKPKPAPPIPHDTTYCQFFKAPKLTADSIYGGYLRWYMMGTRLPMAPVPTNAHPGDSTWFVSEVINGCESDSLPLKVTTIYKPQFSIEASSPFVCQFDSIRFAYKGPSLFDPKYSWGIPPLSTPAHGSEGMVTTVTDSFLYVRFDSVTANNYITLHVTDDHGFCFGDTSMRIKIVEQPYGKAASKGDVCVGEQVSLALGARGSSASNFQWFIDKVPMDKSNAVSILAHNSNSGGPFTISWNDSGRHAIQLVSKTEEGCTSLPTEDTISVHTLPDAGFTYSSKNGTLCLEDSILFTANATDYNYAYMWSPEHFFSNVNKRQLYGRVELAASAVTLQVTDPFGCVGTSTQTLTPGECCRVSFPTAFLPNGGTKNTVFRPIYQGYHRFSIFRIANRWGQTVYESTNNGMSWDGTMNSVPQDAGVYFYYIKYDCGGKSMEQTGDVTLIR